MVNIEGAVLVRPVLMADNSLRLIIDCGELINLGQVDDLRKKALVLFIAPMEDLEEIKKDNEAMRASEVMETIEQSEDGTVIRKKIPENFFSS